MVERKDIVVPEAYVKYVNAVRQDTLQKALQKNSRQFRKLLRNIPKKKIDYAYAEGKWTIRQLMQHLIDAERVFVSRALWFSRKDAAPLPGFDEDTWAVTSGATSRKWKEMIVEFDALRESTEVFFSSLDDEQLLQKGTANNNQMNVLGLGFVCAGHVAHHINIINERYLGKKVKSPYVEKLPT